MARPATRTGVGTSAARAHAAAGDGAGTARPPPRSKRARMRRRTPARRDYEMILDAARARRWLQRTAVGRAGGLRHRDHQPRLHAGRDRRRLVLRRARRCAAYVPVAHRYPGAPDQLDRATVLARLKPWLENPAARQGGPSPEVRRPRACQPRHRLRGMRYDSMLESYVLDSTATRHDMDSVARHYLGVDTIHFEDVAGKGAKQITFDQVAVENAARVRGRGRRHHAAAAPGALAAARRQLPGARRALRAIEQPLVPVLTRHGGNRRARRHATAAQAGRRVRREDGRAAEGRPTRSRGIRSTSIRRSSCRKCSSTKLKLPVRRKTRRPASPRPTRTCWRNSPRSTRCRG